MSGEKACREPGSTSIEVVLCSSLIFFRYKVGPHGHATTKLVEDFLMLPKEEPLTPLLREETKVAQLF
jgi:hypothetical protein